MPEKYNEMKEFLKKIHSMTLGDRATPSMRDNYADGKPFKIPAISKARKMANSRRGSAEKKRPICEPDMGAEIGELGRNPKPY